VIILISPLDHIEESKQLCILGLKTTFPQLVTIIIGPLLYLSMIACTLLGGTITSRGGLGIVI